MNRETLISELRGIVGDPYMLIEREDVIVYEQDGSIFQVMPEIVVLPADVEQVSAVIKAARQANVPIVPRGSGTGLAGGAVPAEGGIVLSLARLNRILKIDLQNHIAIVEPGVINVDVTKAVAKDGFFYAPDPSSQAACSIGGNVANNSGGPHTLAYGVTTNHVLGVEVVLDDGQIVWLGGEVPDTPGYDLCGVFVGSEGTMGIVTKAVVKLMRTRESVLTLLAIFDRMETAMQTVVDITGAGIIPAALEMMDRTTIEAVERGSPVGFPRDAEAVLLVEVEGITEQTERSLDLVRVICERNSAREVRVAKDDAERQRLWKGRKGAFGAMGTLAPNYYVQDGVVPRSKLPEIMKRIAEISQQFNLRIANVFHAGDGNLHPNILFDIRTPGELDRVIEAGAATLRACIELGGSITGEHGVGLEKKAYIGLLFNETDLEAMTRVRRAFDPDGRFNPAKLFPTPMSCGEMSYQQANIPPAFGFDMAADARTHTIPETNVKRPELNLPELYQCVHCGLCLNQCPTYRALRLEPESPRGRIHLVRAAAEGRIDLTERFKDHLYLCLLCRACETACPSGVQYGHIAETAREQLGPPGTPFTRSVLNFVFTQLLPYPNRLRLAANLLRLYQRTGLQLLMRSLLPKKLREMDSMLPSIPQNFFQPKAQMLPAIGERRAKVAMLNGCVMPLLFGDVNEATVRVLRRNGCDVVFPENQICCGALNTHNGESAAAKRMARQNIDAFLDAGVDAVIVNAAGCGAAMKEYGHLLRDDSSYAEKAKRFGSLVKDASEFIADLGLVGVLAPMEMTVTYQDPCHLAHGQRVRSQPRKLLQAIPQIKFIEAEGSDRCCGSAGIYNLTHPEMSQVLLREKMQSIAETKAEAVVAPNPGCMLQLRYGAQQYGPDVKVYHLIDLLDRAYAEADGAHSE